MKKHVKPKRRQTKTGTKTEGTDFKSFPSETQTNEPRAADLPFPIVGIGASAGAARPRRKKGETP